MIELLQEVQASNYKKYFHKQNQNNSVMQQCITQKSHRVQIPTSYKSKKPSNTELAKKKQRHHYFPEEKGYKLQSHYLNIFSTK